MGDRKSGLKSVTIHARGHANIKGTHQKSFEFSESPHVTEAGTCIVGVAAKASIPDLFAVRGDVEIEMQCGRESDAVGATINPLFIASDPLIVRVNPAPQHRSFCIAADRGAASLDRHLIDALREPNAELTAAIREKRGGRREITGALFVVATPIGDRRDLSARAEATLASVDTILAEDTRTTKTMIAQTSAPVNARVVSFHDHNEQSKVQRILDRLAAGDRVALVSEAGMPLISDPGYHLISAAATEGHPISPLPGPNAVTAALSISGLPCSEFRFLGFLSRKRGARRKLLEQIGEATYTCVFFEAPHRIVDSLTDIARIVGNRPLAVCRNMTKPGEQVLRGTAVAVLEQLRDRDAVRGEFTVVVGPGAAVANSELARELRQMTVSLIESGVSTKAIALALSQATGLPRREMFAHVVAFKESGSPSSNTTD